MGFLNDNISGPQPRGVQTPRCTFEEGELSAEASGLSSSKDCTFSISIYIVIIVNNSIGLAVC